MNNDRMKIGKMYINKKDFGGIWIIKKLGPDSVKIIIDKTTKGHRYSNGEIQDNFRPYGDTWEVIKIDNEWYQLVCLISNKGEKCKQSTASLIKRIDSRDDITSDNLSRKIKRIMKEIK
jgi:hypothetical protein